MMTNPGRKELSWIEVRSETGTGAVISKVRLKSVGREEETFLLAHHLTIVEEIVPELEVILQTCWTLPKNTQTNKSRIGAKWITRKYMGITSYWGSKLIKYISVFKKNLLNVYIDTYNLW